jgi:hypothetical protein
MMHGVACWDTTTDAVEATGRCIRTDNKRLMHQLNASAQQLLTGSADDGAVHHCTCATMDWCSWRAGAAKLAADGAERVAATMRPANAEDLQVSEGQSAMNGAARPFDHNPAEPG